MKERMRALVRITDFDGVEFKTAIRAGFAEDEICDYAQKNSMDLIVTATHGRTGLRHALLGGVAEHIVRYAKGPVLVVPTRWGAKA
jgi:nucleotide-binding universal stress UspA family protein